MNARRMFGIALFVCTTGVLAEPPVSVGSLSALFNLIEAVGEPALYANLSSPASSSGTLTTATVAWNTSASGKACSNAFKIKFFRRGNASLNEYQVVAVRGPFTAANGLITVPLSPPVTVAAGDVIGLVKLTDTCGAPWLSRGGSDKLMISISNTGDAPSFDLRTARMRLGDAVGVRASAGGRVYEGTIVVAGSVAGAFGTQFKTRVQLANRTEWPISGTLVFHPIGQAASPGDPTLAYTVPRNASVAWDDIAATMGRTGLGSIDVYSTSSFAPEVEARVFDDQGAAGTSGFTEELIVPGDALGSYESASFALPPGPTFRVNVGIRSLSAGAQVLFRVFRADGGFLKEVVRQYPPDYFVQASLLEILGIPTLPPSGRVELLVLGSAMGYVSTTDNRTNDSSARMIRRP